MTFKQKPLHSASLIPRNSIFSLALCFCCTLGVAGAQAADTAAAQPDVVRKSLGEQGASLRLIDGGGLDRGTYVAGIEITMTPGAHTYWKMPGDAGVPPVFAFNGSDNVETATVLFPTPTRIVQDGLEAFGYADHVVFPVMVTPHDAAKPAVLHADVTYAVCAKICLPEHGDATITLRPDAPKGREATIDAALAAVPIPAAPATAGKLMLTRDTAAKTGRWSVAWSGEPIVDVFADAPEGFYFDTRKTGASTWSLVAASSVGQPSGKPVPVTLTLARANGTALSVIETLDVGASTQ